MSREPDSESSQKSSNLDRIRRQLESYMSQQGLRSTEQRRVIIDAFLDFPEHVTIDQLLQRVRKKDQRVGYATVYRTMKMLSDGGIVQERKFGDGFTRYELADHDTHHDHLICLKCGQITEFEEPLIEELQERVATRYGFTLQHHSHELYGLCTNCQKTSSSDG